VFFHRELAIGTSPIRLLVIMTNFSSKRTGKKKKTKKKKRRNGGSPPSFAGMA